MPWRRMKIPGGTCQKKPKKEQKRMIQLPTKREIYNRLSKVMVPSTLTGAEILSGLIGQHEKENFTPESLKKMLEKQIQLYNRLLSWSQREDSLNLVSKIFSALVDDPEK